MGEVFPFSSSIWVEICRLLCFKNLIYISSGRRGGSEERTGEKLLCNHLKALT